MRYGVFVVGILLIGYLLLIAFGKREATRSPHWLVSHLIEKDVGFYKVVITCKIPPYQVGNH